MDKHDKQRGFRAWRWLAALLPLLMLLSCGPTTRPGDLLIDGTLAQPTLTSLPATPTLQPTALPGIGPDDFPNNINPLTGLEVSDPAVLDRKPVGVKINNYPRTDRPQWGLSLADIVYEYYHNNDLPRFHAIFYGQDATTAGPIRSGRPFDSYLVNAYKESFVFASADARVLERMVAEHGDIHLIYWLDGQCPPWPVCRYEPETDNSLITDTSIIDDFIEADGHKSKKPDLDGMWFNGQTPNGGDPIEKLYINYSYSAYLFWEFYPESGNFLRFQDADEAFGSQKKVYQPLMDRITGEQISAENVVVLVVPHIHRVYEPPAEGNAAIEVVDMEFYGSGEGYAMRDGRMYNVHWERANKNSLPILTLEDGQPYPYKPGKTWYQVITPESEVTTKPEEWQIDFDLVPKLKEWDPLPED